MSELLRFDTDRIAEISSATLAHQQQWDAIWARVRSRLSATAAQALSREPGGSLDARTAEYHRRTAQYNGQLASQARAVGQVGRTAAECNAQMTRVLGGR